VLHTVATRIDDIMLIGRRDRLHEGSLQGEEARMSAENEALVRRYFEEVYDQSKLEVLRWPTVTLEGRKVARLAHGSAHLLDGGDVEVSGELLCVGEQKGGAQRQIERLVVKFEMRERLGQVTSLRQSTPESREEPLHRCHPYLTQILG
jgi:hypothetical protein